MQLPHKKPIPAPLWRERRLSNNTSSNKTPSFRTQQNKLVQAVKITTCDGRKRKETLQEMERSLVCFQMTFQSKKLERAQKFLASCIEYDANKRATDLSQNTKERPNKLVDLYDSLTFALHIISWCSRFYEHVLLHHILVPRAQQGQMSDSCPSSRSVKLLAGFPTYPASGGIIGFEFFSLWAKVMKMAST